MRERAVFFDLDGTLYRGSEPVPHAAEAVAAVRRLGKAVRFLTNNSGATPAAVAEKLVGMGIEADPSEVVTSGMAAAEHLLARRLARVFLVGEPGLAAVLRGCGLEIINALPEGGVSAREGVECDAVVCGICRGLTYSLLSAALQALLAGAEFVATNADPTYPMEKGRLEPGAGSLVAALAVSSGVEPFVAGKPSPEMILIAARALGLEPEDVLVVGDRVDTDIAAALAAGCRGLLVLTGATAEAPKGVPFICDLQGLLDA